MTDNEPWQNVPYVNFNRDNRQVKLNANWYDNGNDNLAVPVLRDFSSTEGTPHGVPFPILVRNKL